MVVRAAVEEDMVGVLAIYNEVIANTTAVYREEAVTLEERVGWFRARRERGFPVLVACEGDRVVWFASFGEFRGAPCYRYTVETTVHVDAGYRGRGVGRELVKALFPLALEAGVHAMVAAVDGENVGSVRFHEGLGFEVVARFRQVGRKFGRWLDLVFLERMV
jgi:L-amino acid N-acyltransferase YncA